MARDSIPSLRDLRRTPLPALTAIAAFLFGGTGCQTLDPSSTAAKRLQRATATLEQSSTDRQTADARRQYRRAVAEVLPERWPGVTGALVQQTLTLSARARVPPWRWMRSSPRFEGLHRDGVGLPIVERITPPGANGPRGGYHVPRTALAWVDSSNAREVEVELLDPRQVDTAKIGNRQMPLAMDLEAPLDVAKGLGPPPLAGLVYLLRANRFSNSNLTFLEPYDPTRTPVVLIHGLLSTPRMWSPVVKALLADPKIRAHYQFWFFYYPTGQPIPLSVMQLRDALDEAVRVHQVKKPLVLIGHSMGGILARAQVERIPVAGAERMLPGVSKLPAENLVRRALVFEPRTDVQRAVFIATPHRGSDLASHGLVGIAIRLIRLPGWIQGELTALADLPFGGRTRHLPTSICGLSPNSQFLRALDRSIATVPLHSIIANRGQANLARSSDGVVPYTSAHLPAAVSEVIVPAGHGGFSHPLAIQELRRILLENKP